MPLRGWPPAVGGVGPRKVGRCGRVLVRGDMCGDVVVGRISTLYAKCRMPNVSLNVRQCAWLGDISRQKEHVGWCG